MNADQYQLNLYSKVIPSRQTRQECENIKDNVPMQTLEQQCETKYVEECSTPGTPTTVAASYMPMMPLSAPPTRRPLDRLES